MDRLFLGRTDVEVVAVSDPVEAGRKKVQKLYPEAQGFANYRQLLAETSPDLVVVAPRWTDQHYAMAKAALEAGAHVWLEKPMTQTLAEADELLNIARRKGLRIAVAHQMMMDPNIQILRPALRDGDGLIGALQEIHVFGKMDARAGAEDLLVLGTHLFDMVRWFGGDPVWCTAHVTEKGEPITRAHARKALRENLGPIAGDQIHAQILLDTGVFVHYTSRAGLKDLTGGWGFELRGKTAAVRVYLDHPTHIFVRERKRGQREIRHRWWRWPDRDAAYPDYAGGEAMDRFNRLLIDNWLRGIDRGEDPLCSGERAMKSLEILHGILLAGLRRERVSFPLEDRGHPLAE